MLISRPPTPRLDACRAPLDSVTLDASTSKHGLLPKLPGGTSTYLRSDGTWVTPPGGGGGEANTASNVGTAGVGIFKQKSGTDLQFKKLNAGSSKVTITDDTGANEVDVDVVEANLTLSSIGGTLSVAKGGTNATTASDARTSLGLGALAVLATVGASQIDNAAVTLAKLANLATDNLIGRSTAGTGVPEAVPCTAAGRALLAGAAASDQRTTLGLGALATLSAVGTSQITDNNVTLAKLATVATDVLLGRSTAGTGNVETIPCTAAGRAVISGAAASDQRTSLGLGALATLATVGTSQIDNDAVTFAKLQNIATNKLLGRSTASSGDPEEIAIGSGLDLSGGTLSATGTPTFPLGMIIWSAASSGPSLCLPCDGAAVSRSTYSALFGAIGTGYGSGDGSTTFNVPDLRGRTAIGTGTGAGLTARSAGQSGGEETHILTAGEMPSHTHDVDTLSSGTGVQSGTALGPSPTATTSAGGDAPHNNMQPYLVIAAYIYAGV